MQTVPLREHMEWHLRRLKSARAAAAELSLRAETDGLQWLSVTHFAVLALEATLAEEVAPDHKALEEVIADLTSTGHGGGPQPEASPMAFLAQPPLSPPTGPEGWTTALASLSTLAFPWRPPVDTRRAAPPVAPSEDRKS